MTRTVVVCGSVNIDTFVRTAHFPVAGETVIASPNGRALGGKGANQAVAAVRFLEGQDARVVLHATVGTDPDGDRALAELRDAGVDVSAVARTPDAPTGQAFIMNDGAGENVIVVTSGANEVTDPDCYDGYDGTADVLLAQGELSPAHTAVLPALARRLGARLVLNLAPVTTRDPDLIAAADPLVLNETEAADLSPDGEPSDLARSVVVTLGARGAVLHERGRRTEIPPFPVPEVVDTTGAGDAFCGVLAAALAEGTALAEAATVAAAAGSLAVGTRGASASCAGREEILSFLGA
ncbi:ribokinase [Corynebacterium kalidii]|uniref:Ribokinase n=1 Tax=Corynebacterium kalidii TaxID=2931982 RepID=A0A9X1WHB5_9CORY|nr:ribokinase [Corynebacterium kalidii]